MLLALKILLGFFGSLMVILSARWLFDTKKMAAEHHIQTTGSTGLNYLKGDIGGVLLAAGIFVGLFLFHDQLWMYPALIILLCVAGSRLLSIVTDGYNKQGMIAIIAELGLACLLYGISILS